jgi:predicted RNA polymerase sigma factor
MQEATPGETHAALSAVFREEAGRLVGALVRILGNFEVAEEIVQDGARSGTGRGRSPRA